MIPFRAPSRPPNGWALAAVVAVALVLIHLLQVELLPLAFAAALAYLLTPLVGVLQRRLHVPRPAAVLAIYAAVVSLAALASWGAVDAMRDRAGTVEPAMAQFRATLGPTLHLLGHPISTDALFDRVRDAAQAWLLQPLPVATLGGVLVAGAAAAVLTLVLLFYFLLSGRQLAEGALWLAPPATRPPLRAHWRRIDPMLRHYAYGMLAVIATTSVAAWLMLRFVFGVPLALPIALAVGVFEMVPIVGPAASMVLLGTIGLLGGGGLAHLAGLMALAVGLRVAIDAVVGPLVLGGAVTLHPVVVIVAFLVAAKLFGILGVIFAVPVAAAVKIVLTVVYAEAAATDTAV